MLFHWLSGEDLSLQERHRALQHAWLLWQRWIMQLSSRMFMSQIGASHSNMSLGSWAQLDPVGQRRAGNESETRSILIRLDSSECTRAAWGWANREALADLADVEGTAMELLWNCYGTAKKCSQDTTRHFSIQLWDPRGFQVLPLYRFERIVSWNVPGCRSGLRRTQSIWHLDARNMQGTKQPPFWEIRTTSSTLFEAKVHSTGFYCR